MTVLCIAREEVYSPGKVDADRAILEAVASHLARHRRVRVIATESAPPQAPDAALVLAMCQGPLALARLRSWQRSGVRVVNTADAIEGCHRTRMLPALRRAAVAHPPSAIVATDGPCDAPEWARGGVWVKRGDVHATHADDVVLVREVSGLRAVLDQFRRRGIERAALQQHVDGEVIKFYAVRGIFFAAFCDGAALALATDERAAFVRLAEAAAAALGLEVFGGDFIREANGRLWLIDLNDWPSYAPCRAAAAEAIAQYANAQSPLSRP